MWAGTDEAKNQPAKPITVFPKLPALIDRVKTEAHTVAMHVDKGPPAFPATPIRQHATARMIRGFDFMSTHSGNPTAPMAGFLGPASKTQY